MEEKWGDPLQNNGRCRSCFLRMENETWCRYFCPLYLPGIFYTTCDFFNTAPPEVVGIALAFDAG